MDIKRLQMVSVNCRNSNSLVDLSWFSLYDDNRHAAAVARLISTHNGL